MSKRSIEDFKAVLQTGGVRPTMFEVIINSPGGILLNLEEFFDNNNIRQLMMLCKSATIPASTVTTVNVGLPAGAALKLPGSRIFDPWNITVINDGAMKMREYFENWSSLIINHRDQTSITNLNQYLGSAEVIQLDRQGNRIRTYFLEGLYPSIIESQQLSYDNNDISEFNVVFNYHYFTTRKDVKGLGGNFLDLVLSDN
ncbi:phage tail protein [Synechococcus sp. AH-551-G15]|nr:phage tail protein [Synechococcus sp. AH-551-G15]